MRLWVTVVLGALGPLAALGACKREPGDPVAEAVARGVREQLGVPAQRVTCKRERCEIELAGGLTIEARVKGDREVEWESEEVIRTAPIAEYIRAELAALGVDAPVDCGPSLVLATAATRIDCTIGAGGRGSIMDRDAGTAGDLHGAAWVDVLSDGGLALELALDDETINARTEPVDSTGLDELSRALDTDEAQGVTTRDENDADPDAGTDAP